MYGLGIFCSAGEDVWSEIAGCNNQNEHSKKDTKNPAGRNGTRGNKHLITKEHVIFYYIDDDIDKFP